MTYFEERERHTSVLFMLFKNFICEAIKGKPYCSQLHPSLGTALPPWCRTRPCQWAPACKGGSGASIVTGSPCSPAASSRPATVVFSISTTIVIITTLIIVPQHGHHNKTHHHCVVIVVAFIIVFIDIAIILIDIA